MRNEKYLLSLQTNMHYTLNCNGQLLDLSTPQVMGILNATPDSFYAASRTQTEREIALRAEEILQQGGTINRGRRGRTTATGPEDHPQCGSPCHCQR